MRSSRPAQSVMQPARVRAARARLLTEAETELAQRVRVVFCEPNRTQIVRALGAGPITVTDLAAAVGRSRSVASQHLRLLREEGFVRAKRRGRRVYYILTSDPVTQSAIQMLDLVAQTAS